MSNPPGRGPGPAARRFSEGWALLAACLLGAAWLTLSGVTAPLDRVVYDLLLNRRPPPPTDRILIVALDQRSLARTGAWPWPRATQAALVRRIAAARPRAIGIDALLTEPRDAAGDAALAKAISAAGTVALPVAFTIPGHNGRAAEIERPLAAFRAAGARLGHVNLAPDSDGVMRSAWLGFAAEGESWPALPLAMLGRPTPRAPATAGVVRTRPVLIDYPGPTGTIPSVPADSVLRGEVPAELIAGKYVLVGMTANGLGDMHATPFAGDSPLMPGVEIQGSLLATLLAGQPLTPAPVAARVAFTLGPLVLLFVLLARVPSQRGPIAALALAGAVAAASSLLMIAADLWMPPAAALLSLSAAYGLWAWRRLAVASRMVSAELERVTAEAGAFAHPVAATGGVLDRQLALLADVTARERELREEHDAVIRLLSHDMRAPQGAILALLDAAPDCPPALATRLRSYALRTLELADGFVSLSRAQLVELAQDLVSLG
ncbi:MAG: CHASE2 domain-containing protein, partial [Sphingomonadales bacterium]|nr:CHASE2 domain-containing protein [Sphingomonadales bacterium]